MRRISGYELRKDSSVAALPQNDKQGVLNQKPLSTSPSFFSRAAVTPMPFTHWLSRQIVPTPQDGLFSLRKASPASYRVRKPSRQALTITGLSITGNPECIT